MVMAPGLSCFFIYLLREKVIFTFYFSVHDGGKHASQ